MAHEALGVACRFADRNDSDDIAAIPNRRGNVHGRAGSEKGIELRTAGAVVSVECQVDVTPLRVIRTDIPAGVAVEQHLA